MWMKKFISTASSLVHYDHSLLSLLHCYTPDYKLIYNPQVLPNIDFYPPNPRTDFTDSGRFYDYFAHWFLVLIT